MFEDKKSSMELLKNRYITFVMINRFFVRLSKCPPPPVLLKYQGRSKRGSTPNKVK